MSAGASTRYDLVVVGGGHNGLVCAAYVAAAGYRVCVLERHATVGGAAVTEEFHPGFRNSAASYTVSLLQPKVIADLELARHGLTLVPRPLANFLPSRDAAGLALPEELAARQREIAQHSTRDAARYPRFLAELEAVTRLVKPLLLEAPVEPGAGLGELRRSLELLGRGFGSGPRTLALAWRLLTGSAGHWLDDHFETDLLKGGLGFDSIVGHFASPYAQGSAYLLLHHSVGELNGRPGAWGHAIGGMGAISAALAKAAAARGVEIRVEQSVDRIEKDDEGFLVLAGHGRFRGRFRARAVAAAVHPRTLFLELLEGAELPAAFRRRIERWQSESASFRMNVALSELPDFSCMPGRAPAPHHGAGILIAPGLGYLDRAHASALASGMADEPIVELVIPSVLDSTLAPAGAHVASLFCQHFRYALPGGASWDARRDEAVDRIIDTVTQYAPNFRRAIVGLSARSPLDLERRFGLVGGDIFHGALTRDQLYWSRPARGFARYRSPVRNLYLCASGAHPGGGVSGAPGHNAAAAIIEDLRHGREARGRWPNSRR